MKNDERKLKTKPQVYTDEAKRHIKNVINKFRKRGS